jgi:V8-like Glu-specific endopeptidase
MSSLRRCRIFNFLSAITLFCLIFTIAIPVLAGGSALPASSYSPEAIAHGERDYFILDCPDFPLESELKRTVMQVIDNRFHQWHEYENRAAKKFFIYMVDPYRKALSAAEARALLTASREWENQAFINQHQSRPTLQSADAFTDSEMKVNLPAAITGSANQNSLRLTGLTDNRTSVDGSKAVAYPFNTIGFLTVNFVADYMRGTGFLVSPYTVLTNAHNVYFTARGGWFQSITFAPGQYETEPLRQVNPYPTLSPVNAFTNENYLYYEKLNDTDRSVKYDYAALLFDETFTGITTFMPLEFNHIPEQISLVGYPGVVYDKASLGMWRSDGDLVNYDEHCLYYEAYTTGGNSGSPVFVYNQQADTYRVIAIHSFAYDGDLILSGGPHFNNQNRQLIEQWLRWTPEISNNPVTSLTLTKTSLTMNAGETQVLTVIIVPEDATNKGLAWSSSNLSVATVDAYGIVKAMRSGNATIIVKTLDGSQEASCAITVSVNRTGFMSGDINGDNEINVLDTVLALQHVLQIAELDEESWTYADVNGDDIVNVLDVTLIMQFALGVINSFE